MAMTKKEQALLDDMKLERLELLVARGSGSGYGSGYAADAATAAAAGDEGRKP